MKNNNLLASEIQNVKMNVHEWMRRTSKLTKIDEKNQMV